MCAAKRKTCHSKTFKHQEDFSGGGDPKAPAGLPLMPIPDLILNLIFNFNLMPQLCSVMLGGVAFD